MSDSHKQSPHERRGQPAPEDLPRLSYPSWRYHQSQPPRLVQSPLEDDELGSGWQDRPHGADPAPTKRASQASQPGDEPEEAKPLQFPSWRYHQDGRSQIVRSEDEDNALGKGWSDSPAPSEPITVRTVTTTRESVVDVANQVSGLPPMPMATTVRDVDPPLTNATGEPVDAQTQKIIAGDTPLAIGRVEGSADDDERPQHGRHKGKK